MGKLSHLYPAELWDNFENICAIPHPSKHEEKLVEWMQNWAKKNNIDCKKDKVGNLIFSKPATKGMENRTPVILQAHVDMVPQANSNKKHDFTKDPIEPMIGEDGWLRANGTTLGADDGIGGAAALIAAENIKKAEVIDFPEFGMEAVHRIEVKDMPAFIIYDNKGRSLY